MSEKRREERYILKKYKQIAENNLSAHQDEEYQKFYMQSIVLVLLLGFCYLHLLEDR
jgi:hypothetical protein